MVTYLLTSGRDCRANRLLQRRGDSDADFLRSRSNPGGETLTFELTVSDGDLRDTGTVSVQVNNVNHPPLADAGPDQTVPENTPVLLDGSASGDTDGDTLAYSWVQTGGTFVTLTGASTAKPTFTTRDMNPRARCCSFSSPSMMATAALPGMRSWSM